ncbi:SET domain-containing protein [Microthyrium microscopicum]|uniref:SET domain-containing protein n=1 Tax=Microthyrium microscopicum TaxID=703497 RepID=A0A6A6UFH2_9PEZI|nr:SET domain-containing protein [Microthyrium microscopicum]
MEFAIKQIKHDIQDHRLGESDVSDKSQTTISTPRTYASSDGSSNLARSIHPSTEDVYIIKETNGKGLGMFAIEDIPCGTLILVEDPLFALDTRCWSAEQLEDKINELDSHEQERFFSLHSVHDLPYNDPSDEYQHQWASFKEARQNHLAEVAHARSSGKKTASSIFAANMMDGSDEESDWKLVLCVTAARINHSCLPNTHYVWNDANKAQEFRVTRDVAAGEEITISYVYSTERYEKRKKILAEHYGFTCHCPACGNRDNWSSVAYQSYDRRFRLGELDRKLSSNSYLANDNLWGRIRDRILYIKLLQEEGLYTPTLGTEFGRVSRCYLSFALAGEGGLEQAIDYARSAVKVLTNCVGAEHINNVYEQKWLHAIESHGLNAVFVENGVLLLRGTNNL